MQSYKINYTYIQFPLCLLQLTYGAPEKGLSIILNFGIVNYGLKFKYDIKEVARQLMYCYYRNNLMIQIPLYKTLQRYIHEGLITIDEEFDGFDFNGFNPEIDKLIRLFETDIEFRDASILRWQIDKAASLLNIRLGSMDVAIKEYTEGLNFLVNFEVKYGADCWPGVKPSQLMEFRDSGKDIDLFRAYIGIRSLIGRNNYIATTKKVILMRTLGCKNDKAMQEFLKVHKPAKAIYDKFTRSDNALRYNFQKLFEILIERGFLKSKVFERTVSRKIFLSIEFTYDQLADEIIKFYKKRSSKKNEQQAREKIRASISTTI
jgi:hypothetical protein